VVEAAAAAAEAAAAVLEAAVGSAEAAEAVSSRRAAASEVPMAERVTEPAAEQKCAWCRGEANKTTKTKEQEVKVELAQLTVEKGGSRKKKHTVEIHSLKGTHANQSLLLCTIDCRPV